MSTNSTPEVTTPDPTAHAPEGVLPSWPQPASNFAGRHPAEVIAHDIRCYVPTDAVPFLRDLIDLHVASRVQPLLLELAKAQATILLYQNAIEEHLRHANRVIDGLQSRIETSDNNTKEGGDVSPDR